MNEAVSNIFNIKKVNFPIISSVVVVKPTSNDFNLNCRVQGLIANDKTLALLFGIQVNSTEVLENKSAKAQVTVEAIVDFEFQNDLGTYDQLAKVPNIANLLAIMYPFIREKIHYCLSSNDIQYILPPLNMYKLIEQHLSDGSFGLEDARVKLDQQKA